MANVAPVLTVHGIVRSVREFPVKARTDHGPTQAAELTILTDAEGENGGFLSVYVGADVFAQTLMPGDNDAVDLVVRLGQPRTGQYGTSNQLSLVRVLRKGSHVSTVKAAS